MKYLSSVLAACSQWLNALLGGNRDQSFSSRSYEAQQRGYLLGIVMVPIINTLFFFQPEHCARAYSTDDERTYT